MPSLKKILNPKSYGRLFINLLYKLNARRDPSFRGIIKFPPGHFYSPLIDLHNLVLKDGALQFDGLEYWEHINLQTDKMQGYYKHLLDNFPVLNFPKEKTSNYRYYLNNDFLALSDAFALSSIIRAERPRKIIEVGSGFSSAVILDTLSYTDATANITFIEPFPERLNSLLSPTELSSSTLFAQPVQTVPLDTFTQLEAQDILFIDSSHVAKVGSDLTFILLRILPKLKPGVIIHFHDIFYPVSYPLAWIREGRAWNESIFLRSFLAGNSDFEIIAFNNFAAYTFPELFRNRLDAFLQNPGGSFWLRKLA